MSKHAREYFRFNVSHRIEHILLLLTFTVLTVTGIPQKYASAAWASGAIGLMGGIELTRQIHHVAAVLLMLAAIYHGGAVTYRVFVKRVRLTMMPGLQDVKDGFQAMGYNVGLVKTPPRMGRYNFGEKIEYWAVIWGTVIMVITGFMLWNPIATTKFLPGQAIPAAKAAHGAEAVLAALSIITWHAYHVHIKWFNRSMFTGSLTHEQMEEEHALELEEIEAGVEESPIPPAVMRRRLLVFYPAAIVISVTLLAAVYWFVTLEETAITTIPRQDAPVFVPITPTPEGGL
jgi:formate dehydrogenase gamma subunit